MFDVVRTFSATKAKDRGALGDVITTWIQDPAQRGMEIVDKVVTQSSDQEFHCLTITLFCRRKRSRA